MVGNPIDCVAIVTDDDCLKGSKSLSQQRKIVCDFVLVSFSSL